MPREKLSEKDIGVRLFQLPHWRVQEDKLHRELSFPDFVSASADARPGLTHWYRWGDTPRRRA